MFRRTDSRSPGVIGKTMYATIAKMLPTIDARNSQETRREFSRSFAGSTSVTRGRNGGNPGFSMLSDSSTTAMPVDGTSGSTLSTAVPGSAPSCCAIRFPSSVSVRSLSWIWPSARR